MLVAAGSYLARDDIHDWIVARDPTCAEPGSLTPLDSTSLDADASSGAQDPSSGAQPADAVDGYAGSWWVPELADPRRDEEDKHTWHVAQLQTAPESRTLVLTLPRAQHVRLVCVINGLPESRVRYLMHGTVASRAVWGDDTAPATRALERLPAERMQSWQDAGGDLGNTTTVNLRIDAVVAGETVLSPDPDDCYLVASGFQMEPLADGERPQRPDPEGCLRAPAPYAGIAEVLIFVVE